MEEDKIARLVASQTMETGDAALIKVDETGLNALPLLPEGQAVDPLTQVAAVGYGASVKKVTDADYTPSIKTGTISAIKTRGGGLISVYEVSADVFGGMSGGPTVTYDGVVVGTNSFGIPVEIIEELGDDNGAEFIGQSARMRELMGSEGVVNELSSTTMDYRAGIDAYFAGNKSEAVRLLTAVTTVQPQHELAREYLERALQLPDPPAPLPVESIPATPVADESGLGLWVWVTVGLGVLALIGLALTLLWRRKSTPVAVTEHSSGEPDGRWIPEQVRGRHAEPRPRSTAVCATCRMPVEGTPFCSNCGAPQGVDGQAGKVRQRES
jgi:hypothetical protein